MVTTLQKKATQAINYFARKKDGKINKMKAIKLVYFADRYHLRKYGRPIVGDTYLAMKYGPVGSNILDIANLQDDLESGVLQYAREYLAHPKGGAKLQEIFSKKEVELDVFSQSDMEALENSYKEFGDQDQFELAQLTHIYPEWAKFKKTLDGGKKSAKMDYLDFFKNPKNSGSSLFAESDEDLELAKEAYQEQKEVTAIFG
jgi:uncharacterized phage-associated protein